MNSLSQHNPVGRFDGRAELYARHRPAYPAAAIQHIVSVCGLGPQSLLIDIGCGTGIFVATIRGGGRSRGRHRTHDEMRALAEQAEVPSVVRRRVSSPAGPRPPGYPDGVADAVLAAQSFHWFEPGVGPARIPPLAKVGRLDGPHVERNATRPMPSPVPTATSSARPRKRR